MQDKFYVYVICDPRIAYENDPVFTVQPVYIGKGSGKRWESHLREAKGEIAPFSKNTTKMNALKDIYDNGFEPVVMFYESYLSEKTAYEIEKQLIIRFGRTGIDENGILTNRVIDQKSLGGGKKGMKHSKPRPESYREKMKLRRGWKHSEETKNQYSIDRIGKRPSLETRNKMSETHKKIQGELWHVTEPNGLVHIVKSLKAWCEARNLSYNSVWGNRDGWKVNRVSSDELSTRVEGYVHITDFNTGEVLVSKNNAVHMENFSEALALSLANRPTGHIHEMVFGNGASTVSGTGAVTYFPPNATGQSAQLYNQTFRKVIDDMSPLNTDGSLNNLRVQHTQNATFSDIVVTCTLTNAEPAGQDDTDNSSDVEAPFVFDELGLKAFDPIPGNGRLLTHVVFHPIQKALNRTIEIVYTIRIYMV